MATACASVARRVERVRRQLVRAAELEQRLVEPPLVAPRLLPRHRAAESPPRRACRRRTRRASPGTCAAASPCPSPTDGSAAYARSSTSISAAWWCGFGMLLADVDDARRAQLARRGCDRRARRPSRRRPRDAAARSARARPSCRGAAPPLRSACGAATARGACAQPSDERNTSSEDDSHRASILRAMQLLTARSARHRRPAQGRAGGLRRRRAARLRAVGRGHATPSCASRSAALTTAEAVARLCRALGVSPRRRGRRRPEGSPGAHAPVDLAARRRPGARARRPPPRACASSRRRATATSCAPATSPATASRSRCAASSPTASTRARAIVDRLVAHGLRQLLRRSSASARAATTPPAARRCSSASQRRGPRISPNERRMLISAYQSELFNRYLDARIDDGLVDHAARRRRAQEDRHRRPLHRRRHARRARRRRRPPRRPRRRRHRPDVRPQDDVAARRARRRARARRRCSPPKASTPTPSRCSASWPKARAARSLVPVARRRGRAPATRPTPRARVHPAARRLRHRAARRGHKVATATEDDRARVVRWSMAFADPTADPLHEVRRPGRHLADHAAPEHRHHRGAPAQHLRGADLQAVRAPRVLEEIRDPRDGRLDQLLLDRHRPGAARCSTPSIT